MVIKAYIGCIGSGKDFLSKRDCDTRAAFADELREDVWKILGWRPKTDKEYKDFKLSRFRLPTDRLDYITGREILQNYGSLRKKEDVDYWVKRLIRRIDDILLDSSKSFCFSKFDIRSIGISDCRFDNEIVGLIKYCEKKSISLEFHHTDFKSDTYDPSLIHESEVLAQSFLGFKGTQQEFDFLIKEKYKV